MIWTLKKVDIFFGSNFLKLPLSVLFDSNPLKLEIARLTVTLRKLPVYMNTEKSVLCDFNSVKVSLLLEMNTEKSVLFDFKSVKVSLLFDMNTEKSVLFGNNSLRMSVLFDKKLWKSRYSLTVICESVSIVGFKSSLCFVFCFFLWTTYIFELVT